MAGRDPGNSGNARPSRYPTRLTQGSYFRHTTSRHLTRQRRRGYSISSCSARPNVRILIYYLFISPLQTAHLHSGVYLFARAVAAMQPICAAGRRPCVHRSVAEEETPVPGSWRAALPRRQRRGGGQRPLRLGGEQTSKGSGCVRGTQPLSISLPPSPNTITTITRCVSVSHRFHPCAVYARQVPAALRVPRPVSPFLSFSRGSSAAERTSSLPGARPAFRLS